MQIIFSNLHKLVLKPQPLSRNWKICQFSTTYSGGHAFDGQGGFYGSLKSRSENGKFKPGSRAEPDDIELLTNTVQRIKAIENQLSLDSSNDEKKRIAGEIRVALEKSNVQDMLQRLQVGGSPVWGLNVEQRRLVKELHEKVRELHSMTEI